MLGITNFLSVFYIYKRTNIHASTLYLNTYEVGTTEMYFSFFHDNLFTAKFHCVWTYVWTLKGAHLWAVYMLPGYNTIPGKQETPVVK